jgi:hypothetical protein
MRSLLPANAKGRERCPSRTVSVKTTELAYLFPFRLLGVSESAEVWSEPSGEM